MKLFSPALAVAMLTAAHASAQITVISTEQFDYTSPGLLINTSGGTGWADSWNINGPGNEIVMFDPTINPPMTCPDSVGNYCGQAQEFVAAIRTPDTGPHPDILDNGMIGADGSIIWVSFRTQQYQVFGDSFGALQFFDSTNTTQEQLLLGSPWATNEWGIDDDAGTGLPPVSVPGTNSANCARLVFRIDHMPGDERVRMWIDPALDFPTSVADLDTMISDLRWDQIRLNSGGSGTHYFWDDIVLAKGEPTNSIGTNYCGPANVNSTGMSGRITAEGSPVVSANDVTLISSQLPQFSFGFSIISSSTGFVMNPAGSAGNLCLSGAIGRYVAPGQIMNSGVAGQITLPINLNQTPQPTGIIAIQAGQTWSFQTWFRDSVSGTPTSNFTDGITVNFL
ncbi:hypothetical protein Poly30_55760 [Planctomycetes bacterium Poly30]|uniref:Uncharacterized protein n=1 Tax=Saltatorellus ferox TaxID=2528018 RepID=A0A518F102_9BACT|nr:hypothetical protein Poly30_55760 [Planctomycetes bacterium Poly30]